MKTNIAAFTYDALAPEVTSRLRETAEAIRASTGRQIAEVIATGRALLDAKETLPHGNFGGWLSAEFGWSERTAQNYMRAAEVFGSNPQRVADLPLNVVYRLAALKPEMRERVLGADTKSEAEIIGSISREVLSIKDAAEKAKKSPEARARQAARKKRSDQLREKQIAERDAKDAADRLECSFLVRDILDAAPHIEAKLELLLKSNRYFALQELLSAKEDINHVHFLRHKFGTTDEAVVTQAIVDTLHRLIVHSDGLKTFPTNFKLAIEQRVWEGERKSASGRPLPKVSFHDFIHDHYPVGLGATYEIVESLIRNRADVLARLNEARNAESGK